MPTTAASDIERAPRERLLALQLERLRWLVGRLLERVAPVRERLHAAGVRSAQDIEDLDDLRRLPFTTKADLREHYPFGLLAVPREELVRVHASRSPKPVKVAGLAAGERVVGLDRAPSGEVLALTSAGRIAVLDATTGKATPKLAAPVTGPVDPNAALTFAVTPDGTSARIITAGRDVTVNLTTGAATAGTGLTRRRAASPARTASSSCAGSWRSPPTVASPTTRPRRRRPSPAPSSSAT
jgi:hypothetical protein